MELRDFLKQAANVRPTKRQMDWYETEFYAFVHFTMPTAIDRDIGEGDEDEMLFNPCDLNCDEWVEAVKSAGMKGIVLTAKHHDGFCLWPSKYTEHCVRNSKLWKDGKGDVVKECADACRRGGIKFGVYLSPWDRSAACYGTEEYNDFYCHQLEELLTGYGELFMVWFDGACFEGPNGKKQEYDFPRYIELIRKYQPNACIFNDHGPDVRWCGNEGGNARRGEWAVVPHELCFRCEKQTGEGPLHGYGTLSHIQNYDGNIGELNNIMYSEGLSFAGAEIDMSIRPSWFYHTNQEPHSLDRLFNTYLNSCGNNTSFNLNVPPMPNGRLDKRDIARLKELGDLIRTEFSEERKIDCKFEREDLSETQCVFKVNFGCGKRIRYVVLREDIENAGQRIENFHIAYKMDDEQFFEGFTVGHKKICRIRDLFVDQLVIMVTSARDTVKLRDITVYTCPEPEN